MIELLVTVWLMVLNRFCAAVNKRQSGWLYVLMWTSGGTAPFKFWSLGRKSLVLMNCPFQNCFLTTDMTFFIDQTDFDAILFNAPDIHTDMFMPLARSEKQIYVFVSTEPESKCPIPEEFDNFFNYTWSYKLNSDIIYPYFAVKNKRTNEVIAPKTNVHWKIQKSMKPTPVSVIDQLQQKSIGAAWFVANCKANKEVFNYYKTLRSELKRWGHQIDIFGKCDAFAFNYDCPRNKKEKCLELVKPNYYFYLSFENTFSEDYVTEKVMTAINNYAVPVVFGGANYSRYVRVLKNMFWFR